VPPTRDDERKRVRAAFEPFLQVLAKLLYKREKPPAFESYWETVVVEVDGAVLTVGDFAGLAGVLYSDFSKPIEATKKRGVNSPAAG
jgi:hypothetical protein